MLIHGAKKDFWGQTIIMLEQNREILLFKLQDGKLKIERGIKNDP